MKKNILLGILFSVILILNVVSVFKTDVNDLSLMSLIQIPQAQAEFGDYYPCGNINLCVYEVYLDACCSCGTGSVCYCYCD